MQSPVHRVAFLAVVLLTACGDEPTKPLREGFYLSTAEQVAIQYALDRVGDSLDVRGATATDSVVADFAELAGLLIRSEGRAQTVEVTLPTGGTTTMNGVALWASGSFAGSAVESQFVVLWDGLDTEARTVRRALLLLGAGSASGSYTLAAGSPSNAARLVEITGGSATIWRNSGGSFAVSDPSFRGSCLGFSSGAGDCTVGRETVTVAASLTTGTTTAAATHGARALPAIHLVAR